jgi:hypothetical protein
MQTIAGNLARGGVVLAVGAVLFFAGCSQSMMGDKNMSGDSKKMMDKDASQGGMMQEDSMKAGTPMKDQEMKKNQ